MLFWTLGGNQVGKAAASGWLEIIKPNLGRIGLWPFDGNLRELFADHDVVVAETYPGEVYEHLGIPRTPVWSKRRQTGRQSVSGHLTARIAERGHQMVEGLEGMIEGGFSGSPSGEDQFDAMVGLLGMLDVVDGFRAEGSGGAPPEVYRWEGWILGQRPKPTIGRW